MCCRWKAVGSTGDNAIREKVPAPRKKRDQPPAQPLQPAPAKKSKKISAKAEAMEPNAEISIAKPKTAKSRKQKRPGSNTENKKPKLAKLSR